MFERIKAELVMDPVTVNSIKSSLIWLRTSNMRPEYLRKLP